MNVGSFAHVLVHGWVDREYTVSDLAVLAYRLRAWVAQALLERWARDGWEGATVGAVNAPGLLIDVRVRPVRPPPNAGYPVWAISSDEARQLVVMSLAVGEVYPEVHDPVGTGPGLEKRLAALREELANMSAARALVA